jgi:hypothetical protein
MTYVDFIGNYFRGEKAVAFKEFVISVDISTG